MTQNECVTFFARAEVTVGPVFDIADIFEDPHFRERSIIVELPDEETGTIPVHNISPRFDSTPRSVPPARTRIGGAYGRGVASLATAIQPFANCRLTPS
jgi:crotonobetainyl-CoA:carnitine CoA-transferase CaiB-like acyl-CoA transferase